MLLVVLLLALPCSASTSVLRGLRTSAVPGQLDLLGSSAHRGAESVPPRCLLPGASCAAFGGECKVGTDCVTNNCYNGKCALGGVCRVNGVKCFQYAQHTCCTGRCEPVVIKRDCLKLLNATGALVIGSGINWQRQCLKVGVCGPWPGAEGPTHLSTPWAVPGDDLASKYWGMGALTFTPDVVVRKDLFIARRMGQKYEGIAADVVHPGAIRDAGIIEFTAESAVDPSMGAKYAVAKRGFCVAPILVNGVGGGFFAVGIDCCNMKGGFACDDALDPNVKTGLVIGKDTENFEHARQLVEAVHGYNYHGEDKGITTPLPIFVRFVKNYGAEQSAPTFGFIYVQPTVSTYCVAPLWDAVIESADEVNFWAAGNDCCSLQEGFHCGAADEANAHSGKILADGAGELRLAVVMATVKYNVKTAGKPMFLSWTAEMLVKPPPAR